MGHGQTGATNFKTLLTMRKSTFKKVLGGAGIGLAAAFMSTNLRSRVRVVNHIGGVPLETYVHDYGMSPKQYGILYGRGNRKGKTNFLRLAHNAKLKRR